MSVANLRYLSVDQALADIAEVRCPAPKYTVVGIELNATKYLSHSCPCVFPLPCPLCLLVIAESMCLCSPSSWRPWKMRTTAARRSRGLSLAGATPEPWPPGSGYGTRTWYVM
jgi:hypothetical protein